MHDDEDGKVKVEDLAPGLLLEPAEGYLWLEVPWSGSNGNIVGNYLQVVSERYQPASSEKLRDERVLYLGTADATGTIPTPGRQVVLAWGKKMTVNPTCWRHIKLSS